MVSLASISNTVSELESDGLGKIDNLDRQLHQRFQNKFLVHPSLTRLIVSFQANKTRPIYRWYKYKEAFSASLIEYLLQQYKTTPFKVDIATTDYFRSISHTIPRQLYNRGKIEAIPFY